MATVNKDFKIKSGLIVEGTSGTINGNNILTETASDQYIIDLIGGETLVTSVESTQLEVVNGELAVKSGVFDAAGAAATALTDAQAYADALTTDDVAEGTNKYYADSLVDSHLYATGAASYSNGQISVDISENGGITTDEGGLLVDRNVVDAWYDAAGAAGTAENDANAATDAKLLDYTTTANLDTTVGGYGYLKSADLSTYATQTYVDTAVSDLVGAAPELLDTLNELAAAIGDDANYATTVSDLIAGKQNNLTAGDGIDITDDTVSINANNGLTFDAGQLVIDTGVVATKTYAEGVADDAETAANSYTDTAITNLNLGTTYDAYGAASTAESNAATYTDNAINALDTDDIEEGSSNLYYTATRAKDAAAILLTGATLSNITITGDGTGLTITAENGVAGSDTDDLAEGSENLYFTDERAIDAVSGADIYPNAVILSNVAKQVATSTLRATAGTHVGVAFAKADYRSAEFLVKVAYGDHTEISKVLLTLDVNDNIAITEYGIVGTNGSGMTVSAGISGTDAQLLVTTANNNTTVTVVGTLLI